MVVIAFIGVFLYYQSQVRGVSGSSDKKAEIIVEDGDSLLVVAKRLDEKNLINSAWSFYLYSKINKIKVLPGDYYLSGGVTAKEIAQILGAGTHQVIKITIPEGWRREQIAQYLSEHAGIDPTEFLSKTENLEGKLFPDTFKLSDQPTADEVIKKMQDDFDYRTAGLAITDEVVAIASIVEREAANDADRADIAGVFINRQKIGMKYESDVTVQFQKDSNNYPKAGILNYKFWKAIVPGDPKNIAGPYNTYLNNGIAGPICNPGIASINATLNPSKHDYYYFLYGNDEKLYLAKNAAEHDTNIRKYLY